ncbi:MAG TPA: hypothetical protein DEQ09_01685 [Bacteroidales bacterium]|nr:hypothetical protein [Bacteroidales bacterium]
MKPAKLKELLLRSLSSELGKNDRAILEKELLADYRFSEGFRDRVMKSIVTGKAFITGESEILRSFDSVFIRVAIPGAAAVIILALSLLLSQGSLSYDTLLGIDNNVDGVLISLLAE